MARMPGAEWQGEHGSRLMDRYDIVCVHTIVGFAPAHAAHFSVKRSGKIIQSRDTRFRSAANLDGNYRVIAIENEDEGRWWEPLTPDQVQSNAEILAWAHETHGIPLQFCPDSRPTSRGLAYHRQGIDGNFGDFKFPGRVPGGEVWSGSTGKVCPGDNKIAQRPEILGRAIALTQPKKDWFDMASEADLRKIVREEQGDVMKVLGHLNERITYLQNQMKWEKGRDDETKKRDEVLAQKVDQIVKEVEQ